MTTPTTNEVDPGWPWDKSKREILLNEAIETVMKGRNNEYGPPTQDFERTAALWSALGFQFGGSEVQPHHVAMAMMLLKLSRTTWSPTKYDHWLDMAGYAACGWETISGTE